MDKLSNGLNNQIPSKDPTTPVVLLVDDNAVNLQQHIGLEHSGFYPLSADTGGRKTSTADRMSALTVSGVSQDWKRERFLSTGGPRKPTAVDQ
ncbi:MAG: hypothetical protein PVI00_04080 [Desulfobacterales bacterium]|jgi:hypothetical protein